MSRRALMVNTVEGCKTFIYAAAISEIHTYTNHLIVSPGILFLQAMLRTDPSNYNWNGALHIMEEARKSYRCTMNGQSMTCVFSSNQYGGVWVQLQGIDSIDSVTLPIELTFTVDGIMFCVMMGVDNYNLDNFPLLSLDSEKYLIPTVLKSSSMFTNNTSSPFKFFI